MIHTHTHIYRHMLIAHIHTCIYTYVHRMWQFKRRINEVSREVKGLLDALEELKGDEINIHLMYLSAMYEDSKVYEELVTQRQVCMCVCMYVYMRYV